jgi:CO/xanthine dehydrogenase FAD-binding subunit
MNGQDVRHQGTQPGSRLLKPAPFDYIAPESLDEVLSLLNQHGDDAKLLAGGQSLIPVLNFRLARPSILIDINRVPGIDGVRETQEGGLSLGAMVRQSRLEDNSAVARLAPLLHGAIPFVAHPQIRNRGTVGGSLAHADPAAELPAITTALDARFQLSSVSGNRWVTAKEFYIGLFETEMQPQEALVAVEFPAWTPGTGWAFQEISRRHGDYAQAGLAAVVSIDESGICSRAKLVFLSVGDTPVEATRAVQVIQGTSPTREVIDEMAEIAAMEEVEPSGDIHSTADFKRHLCKVLTKRVVEAAIQRAGTLPD